MLMTAKYYLLFMKVKGNRKQWRPWA